MEKKGKIHLTNEEMKKKFKSNFDLVNYAIKLAENMIKTGRDARVKSEVQNRAMLILEEIHQGKDRFDEIQTTSSSSEGSDLDRAVLQPIIHEERPEKRRYRTSELFEGAE